MVDIQAVLEALLFVADGPVEVADLADVAQCDLSAVEEALRRLGPQNGRGLCVARHGSRVQLVTSPEMAAVVERYLGVSRSTRLSPAALEALAIIAYRQPITRAQVDALRGVSSDAVIRSLLARSLIRVVGRSEQTGKPELLGTTLEFLHYLGITSLADLPALPESDGVAGSPG